MKIFVVDFRFINGKDLFDLISKSTFLVGDDIRFFL